MTDIYEVSKLGKDLDLQEAESEFFGLVYFSSTGISLLKSSYNRLMTSGKSSNSFIDIMNFMIDEKIKIVCNEFSGGWIELHTENDFKLAEKEI